MNHDLANAQNHLLRSLPAEEQARLAPHLEHVDLELRELVADPLQPPLAVYFPERCIISSVSTFSDGSAVETSTIGREGCSGIHLFHGVETTPEQLFVQVPGDAYRMEPDTFVAALPDCPQLRRMLHRYSVALFTLAGQSSGCNRKHAVLKRCARWILLTHDQVGADTFELTHLILAQMLGVRRPSVTGAAGALMRAGAIKYRRGQLTVVDRAKLEEIACECYFIIRAYLDATLGMGDTRSPLEGVQLSEAGRSIVGASTPEPALG